MFLLLSSSREDLAAVLEHESFTREVRLFPLGGKREKGESFLTAHTFPCSPSLIAFCDCSPIRQGRACAFILPLTDW